LLCMCETEQADVGEPVYRKLHLLPGSPVLDELSVRLVG